MIFILLIISFIQCQKENHVNELRELMAGSFSSQEQAEQDTNYYDIRLYMVPIWENQHQGTWLYVEQAASWRLDKPYRQRIYQLVEGKDGTIQSIVYSIPDPLRFSGGWKNTEIFSGLEPDSLRIREGCVVILKRTGPHEYKGATNENDCQSILRGASYATTEVYISKEKIVSWDRGFDSEGLQVWGATKGGYIFSRIISDH